VIELQLDALVCNLHLMTSQGTRATQEANPPTHPAINWLKWLPISPHLNVRSRKRRVRLSPVNIKLLISPGHMMIDVTARTCL